MRVGSDPAPCPMNNQTKIEHGEDWRSQIGEEAGLGELSDDLTRAREPDRGREASAPQDIPARGWKDILWRVFWSVSEDRVLSTAGGVAFFALLAIFPVGPDRHQRPGARPSVRDRARGRRGPGPSPARNAARKSRPMRVEGEGRRHHLGRSAITPSRSAHPDPACHLSVALPVGALVCNQRILHRRLHIPLEVHRA